MTTPSHPKLIILKLSGDLQFQGFHVSLEIADEDDRIVIIGVSDSRDAHFTPYHPPHQFSEQAGAMLQAQMASQIISAVLDQRFLIWWWPEWVKVLWIGGWAVVGAALAGLRRVRQSVAIATTIRAIAPALCLSCCRPSPPPIASTTGG